MPTEWMIDGVRFTSLDGELLIRDHADESARYQLGMRILFSIVLFLAGSMLLTLVRDHLRHGLVEDGGSGMAATADAILMPLAVVGVLGAVTLSWARRAFGRHEVLRLTANRVTITNVDFGVAWRSRSFPPEQVAEVEYTMVSSSDTADIYAIQFRAGKGRVRLFRYIKPRAAEEVVAAVTSCGRNTFDHL